jgi:hypothetical protein
VGRSSALFLLAACLSVGSAALAQQGLITEPWPVAPGRAASVAPAREMPASGLPSSSVPLALPVPPVPVLAEAAPKERGKWSPPVVTLLVDPWKRVAAPPTARHAAPWSAPVSEIVDPWAHEGEAELPRPRPYVTESPRRSTIF